VRFSGIFVPAHFYQFRRDTLMPSITFILNDGSRQTVDADVGSTVMQLASFNSIRGIDGACGGFCSCATCHVYVESAHRLPPVAADESKMLEGTAAKRDKKKSRLACQLTITPELDGLVLRVPDRQ
jgi:2Fe-2S ferredoxin